MEKNLTLLKKYKLLEAEFKNILEQVNNPYGKEFRQTLQKTHLELLVRTHLFLKEGKINATTLINLAKLLSSTRGQILYYLVKENKNPEDVKKYRAFQAEELERYSDVRKDLCAETKNIES
jgi:hypothetical protein